MVSARRGSVQVWFESKRKVDGPGMPDEELASYYEEIKDCQRCELGSTRTNIVFGIGNPHANLLFVGEAPGKNEDLSGKPFVGAAGKLLDYLLSTIGLTREDVFIANVLKCRPPGNRDPKVEEIKTCRPFLERQIELISPKVICTLGNFATKLLLDTGDGITGLHGKRIDVDGRLIIPSYHPAAALYNPSLQKKLEEDFQTLSSAISEMGEQDRGSIAQGSKESLF